jgi:hypothetical protein
MIVLIPVSRFRVPYEIARGRPYSKLERRVLEAIATGGATLRNLSAAFHVHERLLVESVVTLVNAGWVAVAGGAEATFVLTAEGNAAVDAGQDPVSVVVSQAKPHTVILERVTGQLARHADARSYHRDDLAEIWQSAALVTPRIFRNALDEAQVQKLLPRGPGEWIRWVGPITLASKDRHFLPIDVNQGTGQTRGLPPSWHEPLISHVLAAARRRTAQDQQDATSADRQGAAAERVPPPRTSPAPRRPARFVSVPDTAGLEASQATTVSLDPDDVLVGMDAHNGVLSTALSSASRNVLVASPSVDAARLREFLAESADAVRRRVHVDILVGTTPHGLDQAGVLAAVNRAGYQAAGNDGRALLRTGTQPTGTGASLLLYDDNCGRLVAIIGDHDWLGPPVAATPVSVRLTGPTIVSTLARAAASLWTSAQPSGDPGAADRWRRLASETEERGAVEELRAEAAESGVQTSVEVIMDDEHAAVRAKHPDAVRIGRFHGEPDGGPGAPKGISVQLVGPGAALIAAARAGM